MNRKNLAENDLETGSSSNLPSSSTSSSTLLTAAKSRPLPTVTLLILVWYSSAVVSITTSKTILNAAPLPFFLCLIQVQMMQYNRVSKSLTTNWLLFQFVGAFFLSKQVAIGLNVYNSVETPLRSIVMAIGVTYSLGFVLTNMAFSKVHFKKNFVSQPKRAI